MKKNDCFFWERKIPGLQKVFRIMKLTTYLLLFSVISAFAGKTYSQTKILNLSMNNSTVKDVLQSIENQSEFVFMYSEKLVDVKRVVSINTKNKKIDEVLDELFDGTNVSFKVRDRFILLTTNEIAENDLVLLQQTFISGKVIEQSGSPLPGVSVVVERTTHGTITDAEGNYSLSNVPDNATLIFSFLGMKTQKIPISGKSNINVTMEEEAIGIEEVVAIGYGTQKKASVTGSIASIKVEDLMQTSKGNLSNAIAGQLPGAIVNIRSGEVGADDATILIRGKGTTGENSPLIVIDGIPDRGGFSRLNPEDIESFTILKDASAAIYGARAANGVILIQTKRGKSGKSQFLFSANTGLMQPTRKPDLLDSWQYATVENEYAANFSGQAPKFTEQDITTFKNGSSPLTHPNTDWLDVLTKNWSTQSEFSLSASGGNEQIRYFVSGQYLTQKGIYESNDHGFNQIQWRTNLDANLTEKISLGVDILYRKENRNWLALNTGNFFYEIMSVYPYLVDYYPGGYENYPNGYPGVGLTVNGNMAQRASSEAGYDDRANDLLNSKFTFHWEMPVDGLTLLGYGAYDINYYSQKQFSDIWDEFAYNGQTFQLIPSAAKRSISNSKSNWASTTLHVRLEYKKSFKKHNLDAFAAYEQNSYKYSYLNAYRDNLPSSAVDQIFAGAVNENLWNDGYENKTGRINYFGRINYDYAGKYLATFSLRHDGSYNFPKGKRFGTFPGISLGWRISEESFIADNCAFINNLKVRGSWGILGNDRISPYQFLSSYQLGTNTWWWWLTGNGNTFGESLDYAAGIVEATVPNPNITWEKAETFNLGIEGSFFKHKLDFSIDGFFSNRKDILAKRNLSIPDYTGLSLPDENIGKVLNKGIEAQLTHQNKLSSDFSYSVSGNFTFARNKVKYLDEAEGTPDYQKKEGFPIDSWVLYEADGIFQTTDELANYAHISGTAPGDVKLIDTNGDGKINSKDKIRRNYGITPEIMYGATLSANYKSWNLSILFQGQANAYLMVKPARLNFDKIYFEGRWQKEGDNLYPRIFTDHTHASGQSSYTSTFWLESANFLRLKNIYLSYNLPKSWVHLVKMSDVELYVSGSNLFTIDNIKIFDPELNSNNGITYPLQRVIMAGLKIKF